VKPAAFAYVSVTSVREAISALERFGSDAQILAGGQSLLPVMNMRLAHPRYLVDINQVNELDYIREIPGGLAIGALTRHRTIERSELVERVNPLLQEAVKHIGHFVIRNRGTVGGSLASNFPGSEIGVVVRLLEAEIIVTGPGGQRTLSPEKFFTGYFTTDVQSAEIISEVRLPSPLQGSGYAFVEFSQRHDDPAIVSAAATVSLDSVGNVKEARIALGNVGGAPYLVKATSGLIGRKLDPRILTELDQAIVVEVDPDSSPVVSASYKKHLAGVLSRRAIETALQRIKGGH
jgi:carbon-monoxide dehydrogenase medium subunit